MKEMYPRKACWGLEKKHREVAFYNGVEHWSYSRESRNLMYRFLSQTKVWVHLVGNRVLANFWQKFYKFCCQGNENQPW